MSETAELRGPIPKNQYEALQEKFPAAAEGGDAYLLRAVVDEFFRLDELERMRANRDLKIVEGGRDSSE